MLLNNDNNEKIWQRNISAADLRLANFGTP